MYDIWWYNKLRMRLSRADSEGELGGRYVLLLQVELGLRLLEILKLTDEPVAVVWVLLSGLPIPDARIEGLNDSQRRALANARVLLHFGRFGWESALREYAKLPARWRWYAVDADDLQQPPRREVNGPGIERERLAEYDRCLFEVIPHAKHSLKKATAGRVTFRTTRFQPRVIPLDLGEDLISAADRPVPGFGQERPRRPLKVSMQVLQSTAQQMDEREADRGIGPRGDWAHRMRDVVRYRPVLNGTLGDANRGDLEVDGILHIAGMVASGKSTLMKVLAAHGVLCENWRVVLVVGDTMTAISLADYFNRLLVEGDEPVAVPLIGRTSRHTHLLRFYQSGDLRRDHWGFRWLNACCPLQGIPYQGDLVEPLLPGDEPCERLYQRSDRSSDARHLCPLFSVCPARQVYRDIPGASIWITTPGALASSRPPAHMDARRLRLGELVYQEADLIIFDEVDMIQAWFDDVYATDTVLVDPAGGSLDRTDRVAAIGWADDRALSDRAHRWMYAERGALAAVGHIYKLIQRDPLLAEWIERRYFTAHRLFYDLSHRLAGLREDEETDETPQKVRIQTQLLQHFNLFREDDRLRPSVAISWEDAVYRLQLIADAIIARSGSALDEGTAELCKRWIKDFVSDIDETLAYLGRKQSDWDAELQANQQRGRRDPRPGWPRPDSLDTLAARLEFALSVSTMDAVMRTVYDEWDSAPLSVAGQIAEDERLRKIPTDLTGVIPTAPTGSLFGFQYLEEKASAGDVPPGEAPSPRPKRLSTFQYANVGRWYVLQYHNLLSDLEGRRGPNVLAMSGTSYLPESTSGHFAVAPGGVLEPSKKSCDAIARSEFVFLPQYVPEATRGEATFQPLRVSGSGNLERNIRRVARQLAGHPSPEHSPLQQELDRLDRLATESRELWADRARVLLFVNSYDQVQHAIAGILSQRQDWEASIYGLRRGESGESDWWEPGASWARSVTLSDIERFGQIANGRILVAPLQAVGRAYNILNEHRTAAFGAVFFLTRPMPQPHDMRARARWANRYVLDLCADRDAPIWQAPTYYQKGLRLRALLHDEWDKGDQFPGYSNLGENRRNDLAASMAGIIIQACGRLLRGGVPFHAFFVDAAWGPNTANPEVEEPDTPKTSLLVAMMQVLERYCQTKVGEALYGPLEEALKRTRGLDYTYS